MNEVAIALGTNLGDRLEQLQRAKVALQALCASARWEESAVYATAPVGCPPGSPDFFNAVVVFDYAGTAEALLDACKSIEHEMGRTIDSASGEVNAPRPIDADLLYIGAQSVETPRLIVPHPRLHLRRFVLQPLAELRPDLVVPGQECTVQTLLAELESPEPPLTLVTKEW